MDAYSQFLRESAGQIVGSFCVSSPTKRHKTRRTIVFESIENYVIHLEGTITR